MSETVTSPDEVPEPFPSESEAARRHSVSRPKSAVGTVSEHHAYRNEETERWRIETLRENPAIVENPRLGRLPDGLDVPEMCGSTRWKSTRCTSEFILDLCLNPSVPKPPLEYSPLRRFSPSEVGHAIACYRSLEMAVDLLEGVDQLNGRRPRRGTHSGSNGAREPFRCHR